MVRDLARTRVALGDGTKTMYPSEVDADRSRWPRSSSPRATCRPGTCSAEDDIALKSPGDGLPPYELDRVVGRTLRHPVAEDDALTFELLEELLPEAAGRRGGRPRRWRLSGRSTGRVAVVTGALGTLGPVWIEALADAGATRRRDRPAPDGATASIARPT